MFPVAGQALLAGQEVVFIDIVRPILRIATRQHSNVSRAPRRFALIAVLQ